MIDNIRFKVIDKNLFEKFLEDSQTINLETSVNIFTGELNNYPKKGNDENIEVKISQTMAFMCGSLHKYNNTVFLNEQNHNYNDFYYSQVVNTINHLSNKFQLNANTSVTNLEFGFNLEVKNDPKQIIDYNILMYKLKNHSRDLKYNGKGDFKEFKKSDYSIKIYNKSKQYKLNQNILRVEIKIIKKRMLHKLGIYSIEDLLCPKIFKNLYEFLFREFNEVLIIDEYHNLDIPENDLKNLNTYTNPNYWNTLKKENTHKVQNRLKKEFNSLIEKHRLDKTKKELLNILKAKFVQLMEINTLKDAA